MKLSFADEGAPPVVEVVDGLATVDAFCLFIAPDERPLKGLSAAVDWRLCGELSSYLIAERFAGAPGEALLFPSRGKIPGQRVFCFGVGPWPDRSTQLLGRALFDAVERMGKAGSRRFATMLPAAFGMTTIETSRFFIREVAGAFAGDEIVLVGNARALAQIATEIAPRSIEVESAPWLAASPLASTGKFARPTAR